MSSSSSSSANISSTPPQEKEANSPSLGKTPPRDSNIEAANHFFLGKEGYEYINSRCKALNTDIFRNRFLVYDTYFFTGEDAARVFYDNEKIKRTGVAPFSIRKTLLGDHGVHGLDGEQHHNRKAMFMKMMTKHNMERLSKCLADSWENRIAQWPQKGKVTLLDESSEIITRAMCNWMGVPIEEKHLSERSADIFKMVDAFGSIGPRNWKGMTSRKRSESWFKDVIKQVRDGKLQLREDAPARVIAFHMDEKGEQLSLQLASVELLNVIRPTVAVSYLVTFTALALQTYPQFKKQLLDAHTEGSEAEKKEQMNFIQEIRRFYPFTPFMGGYALKDFEWKGYHIPKDKMLVLDIHGINRDERCWENGREFNPNRFRNWKGNPYTFLPNGGGDHDYGHRCAGEQIVMNVLRVALDVFLYRISYTVPEDQDLTVSTSRIPTYPKSRFIMTDIQLVPHSKEEELKKSEQLSVSFEDMRLQQGNKESKTVKQAEAEEKQRQATA